jgi:hypothetical protein
VFAVILGLAAHGLSTPTASASLIAGALMAIAAFVLTNDPRGTSEAATSGRFARYRNIWLWLLGVFFAMFAVRAFCWLVYIDGSELKIQSPNNLGDLALHITYIRNLASGVPFWPDNPIYIDSHLRYPVGIDLFNALLLDANVDLIRGLVWVALIASGATFYAFYRWGGAFGIAGFLFNGGIVGFQFLSDHQFVDLQDTSKIAWKSIPLTMLVTQRGLLYAIPVGLLLLWHWREKFFRDETHRGPLPFWVELSLYASMPLFHFHTFLALSLVLLCFFLVECGAVFIREQSVPEERWTNLMGKLPISRHALALVASSVLPATLFVWLTTDGFRAGSILGWQPGWVQALKGDELARPFLEFWFVNFGLWGPAVLALFGFVIWRIWKGEPSKVFTEGTAFLLAALLIFLLSFLFRLAPWGWDNMKVLIWAYFIILPFLWRDLIGPWPVTARVAACVALFGSGFVSLLGGLSVGPYGFANRAELDLVGQAVQPLPVEARFAAFPTYNHPLLLQGRKLAMGYPGHLWTQGFANYGETQRKLSDLMQGSPNWLDIARNLHVRYIFWGHEEERNYPTSTRPWEKTSLAVKSGVRWGTIYDLNQAAIATNQSK